MANPETVVAVYDNFDIAENAVRDLVTAGFDRNNISLVANNARGQYRYDEELTEDVSGSDGAGFGAVIGGITGVVAGLTAIVIPGIGPIIAAGPLAALLGGATGAVVGATAGAVTGGLTASLVNVGMPSDEAEYYTESVRRGGALVTVTVHGETQASDASNVLLRHHPVDMDRRVNQWREKGWQGFDTNAEPYSEEELVRENERYSGDLPAAKDDTIRRYPPVK